MYNSLQLKKIVFIIFVKCIVNSEKLDRKYLRIVYGKQAWCK